MTATMHQLKMFRNKDHFFEGSEGIITIRDLIKWGGREITTHQQLCLEGVTILAERVRDIG